MNLREDMEEYLRSRLQALHTCGEGTIGDMLQLELLEYDRKKAEFLLRGRTEMWMRNLAGTLHGGMCATVLDQAMGCVAYCAKPGEGTAPTVQLQVSYHRPLIPGEEVLIRVRVVCVTRSLMHLSCEAMMASAPEKLCLTGTAVYFYKPAGEAAAHG